MQLVLAQNAMLQNVQTFLASAQQFVTNHETLAIGVTTYVGGLLLLDMLEKTRTRNNLPTTVYINPTRLTSYDKSIPWITPSTMDSFKSPPTIENLQVSDYLVGVRASVAQRITLKEQKNVTGISGLHDEWSALYDTKVYIFKQKLL